MIATHLVRDDGIVLSCDVGTSSCRTALFSVRDGSLIENSLVNEFSINLWTYKPLSHDENFMEQSSMNIWTQICRSVRKTLELSRVQPEQVIGLCFDATCSLVAWNVATDSPVSVTFDETDNDRNVILWADHRSIQETNEINQTQHNVLRFVGGRMSPEMQLPKIKFLQTHCINHLNDNVHYFDLADWLTFKCSGNIIRRSQCTTACKWGYVFSEDNQDQNIINKGWNAEFLQMIGLKHLVEPKNRIGSEICEIGTFDKTPLRLSNTSAQELGLLGGTPIAVPVIDAHAGGIGIIGAALTEDTTVTELERTLVLIVSIVYTMEEGSITTIGYRQVHPAVTWLFPRTQSLWAVYGVLTVTLWYRDCT